MVEPAARRRRKTSNSAADQIVVALEQLLARDRIDTITVNDILRSAGVARGTFYFWFTSKYDVVAHAHRTVTAAILAAAAPWFENPDSPPAMVEPALRGFIDIFGRHAPVLNAASETWRTQPEVRASWDEMMGALLDSVEGLIRGQQQRGIARPDLDARATAEALVWMNERTLYVATCDDPTRPIPSTTADALITIWSNTLYGPTPPRAGRKRKA